MVRVSKLVPLAGISVVSFSNQHRLDAGLGYHSADIHDSRNSQAPQRWRMKDAFGKRRIVLGECLRHGIIKRRIILVRP